MTPLEIRTRATRNDWLKAIYQNGLVRHDQETLKLADKLFAAEKFRQLLGAGYARYFPKTIGLQQFAKSTGLSTISDRAAWLMELKNYFPTDVIIKPCAVINTGGETEGYFFGIDAVADALMGDAKIRQALDRQVPYLSPLLGQVVSGEEFIFQENVPVTAGYPSQKSKSYSEVRIHTYEDQVLANAMYSRWAVKPVGENEKFWIARDLVSDLLQLLPAEDIAGQAWALDVFVFENGHARIIDLNTNRGRPVQWSGYLARPELLGAYTRLFENEKNVHFAGLQGLLARNNWGNYFKYLKKYYVEGIR